MDQFQYTGQILGTATSDNLPRFIRVDENGNLVTLPLSSEVTVLASVARTVSGDTSATPVDVGKYKEAVAFLDVTASSGTSPTLDVKLQTQDPVSLKWFDVAELTFAQKTGVASEMKTKANLLGNKLRCVYTLGGTTPSFTFSVGLVLKS
jgi:hypothetical protein